MEFNKNECLYCGCKSDDLCKHLKENHFMTMEEFIERRNSPNKDEEGGGLCRKCNNHLYPLQILYKNISDYCLPCWNCIGNRKYERVNAITSVQGAIHDFYSWVLGDRYFQMFLVDDIYKETTLSHRFEEFKQVLKVLGPEDRNKLWLIDYIPGYSRTICLDNINGLKIVDIEKSYEYTSDAESKILTVNGYNVIYPEVIPYDRRHHSRHNIFNTSSLSSNTKRIRFTSSSGKSEKCVKLFNCLEDEKVKSIFQIEDSGEVVDTRKLSKADSTIIKLLLMRNKSFIRLIINILDEACKNVSVLRDGIFLKNTVTINPWLDKNNLKFNITWFPEYKEGYINISIL